MTMVKNMLSSVEYDGGTYSCVYPWSSDSFVKISTTDISYIKEGKMKTKKDVDYKYLFAIFHPIPENISMPDVFIFEKWQKQRIWITGYGINLEEAEKAAFNKYKIVSSCPHTFKNNGDKINGDASCKNCSVYVSELFLHKDIHYAKYNSLAFHKNDFLFDDITVKSHLMSTTQEMAYDPNLNYNDKINLMCAGWMHHTNGQLHYNDLVEKILKYFYLDPKSMNESVILKYYDCVDMIKLLLDKKNYDILKRQIEEGNELIKVLNDLDLPHASFLQSYILMGEQTILILNH